MAYIKIKLDAALMDGHNVTFKAPCECTAIDGLKVCYIENDSLQERIFVMKDTHGNALAGLGNLFAEGAYVHAILDSVNGVAYLQNADTNGYLESKLNAAEAAIAANTENIEVLANNQIPEEYLKACVDAYIVENESGLATKTELEELNNDIESSIAEIESDINNLSSEISEVDDKINKVVKYDIQLLKQATKQSGYWAVWSGNDLSLNASTTANCYEAIELKANVTYRFIRAYGYFTFIFDTNGNLITRLTESTANSYSGDYTPSVDCVAYVSEHINDAPAMVINNNTNIPTEYVEGIYNTTILCNTEDTTEKVKEITVKKDGSGDFSSVIDAVNKANEYSANGYDVNIYIHSGEYDIFEELGGEDWLSANETMTGYLGIVPANNVNLIGVGYVVLVCRLPDTANKSQTTAIATLSLWGTSNRIENITFIGKNVRYTCHDEADGGNKYIKRYVKNCTFIHEGNAEGQWAYPTVYGAGSTGGSTYDFINCTFKTDKYFQAFSFHTNYNSEPSFFNIDGCVGICNSENGNSFRCSYFGTGHKGTTVFHFKNCSGNGKVVKQSEASGSTDHIEMYVNGYNQITIS